MANDFTLDRVSGDFKKRPQDSDWVTAQKVLAAKPEMIFYGATTPWWTHNPDHLSKLKMTGKLKILNKAGKVTHEVEPTGLPCDPIGGTLFETKEVEKFLYAAIPAGVEGKYGRHGVRAFEMAHHENQSTPFKSWDEYNALLDKYLKWNKIGLARLKSGFCPYCNTLLGLVDENSIWLCDSCGVRLSDEFKKELEKGN